jgi:hypothetical protein
LVFFEGEKMKIVEAYKEIYKILDEYWESVRKEGYDELANMMSDMNPYFWKPREELNEEIVSADPSVFKTFEEDWDKIIGKGKDGTNEQIFKVAKKSILDYYQNEVEYYLADAEKYLKEKLLRE